MICELNFLLAKRESDSFLLIWSGDVDWSDLMSHHVTSDYFKSHLAKSVYFF